MAEILIFVVCPAIGVALAVLYMRWKERRRLARVMAGKTFEDRAEREGIYRQQAFDHFAAQDHGPILTRAPGLRVLD